MCKYYERREKFAKKYPENFVQHISSYKQPIVMLMKWTSSSKWMEKQELPCYRQKRDSEIMPHHKYGSSSSGFIAADLNFPS